ncbi:MAG: VWA domain-containing protein [Acidobacteriota bacterium]
MLLSKLMRSILPLALMLGLVFPALAAAEGAETPAPLLLVFDASGSMWGQIEGENKIVIARQVLGDLVDGLPKSSEVGVVAYGHRSKGDCEDIETVVPLSPLDKASLKQTVNALNPKGKTPITKSIQQALDIVRQQDEGATIILVSDGLETCGGDPCAAVRAAKEQGANFLLHVVGFDVEGEDLSQLECAAQAGGGLFRSADNAAELGEALEAAVALPVDLPIGRLAIKGIADDELQDVSIRVNRKEDGEEMAVARTYRSSNTNPSSIPLPDGTFDVRVLAIGIKGDVERHFEVEIKKGSTVEKTVDFSTGELLVAITKNGSLLADGTVRVRVAGTKRQVAISRTYTSANTNPRAIRLTSGIYDVEVKSVEIEGKPTHLFQGIEVPPQGSIELSHEFASGMLSLGAVQNGDLVDVTVGVVDADTGKAVCQGRTYADPKTNPKTFEVPPGRYRVNYKAVRREGKPTRQLEVTVEAGQTVEQNADFGS